jgi:hypothetical protein
VDGNSENNSPRETYWDRSAKASEGILREVVVPACLPVGCLPILVLFSGFPDLFAMTINDDINDDI